MKGEVWQPFISISVGIVCFVCEYELLIQSKATSQLSLINKETNKLF